MRQILLRIPLPGIGHPLTLYGYGAMLCLGFLAAIWTARWRARRLGQPVDTVYNAALFAFLGGVFGARLFFLVQQHFQYGTPLDLLGIVRIWEGGLTYYGGLILAAVGVIGYLAASRQPVLYWADIFAPSLALGLAFGRGGCFLNGCCFGDVSRGPWAFAWPAGSIPWHHYAAGAVASHGIALEGYPGGDVGAVLGSAAAAWQMPAIQPAQVYSAFNALTLFAVLALGFRWKRRHGQVFMAFLLLYGVSRFLLEFLRADEDEIYFLGLLKLLPAMGLAKAAAALPHLTISQNVAILMVAGSLIGLGWLARPGRPHLAADAVPPVHITPKEGSPDARPQRQKGKKA
jgi:phosphatidylglycerol:prolipoprotein diacylglycerol transferase